MAAKRARKLGRPPASSSAETRERILGVARVSFAEQGYGVTTNKYVATKAGITTGALYHYFDSKLDIYLAVNEHVQRHVYARFRSAIDAHGTFLAQFEAILQAAYELNLEDPSLARFIGAARIDIARHDELRQRMAVLPGEGTSVLNRLLANGVATGEIRVEDRRRVGAFIRTVFVGLVDAVSDDTEDHAAAIEAIRSLLHGRLLEAPATAVVSAGAPRRTGSRRSTSS